MTFRENISHQHFLKVRRWGRLGWAEERRRWPQRSRIGPLPRPLACSEIILSPIFCRRNIHLNTNRIIQSDQLNLVVGALIKTLWSERMFVRNWYSPSSALLLWSAGNRWWAASATALWEQIAGIPWLQKGRLGDLIRISFIPSQQIVSIPWLDRDDF